MIMAGDTVRLKKELVLTADCGPDGGPFKMIITTECDGVVIEDMGDQFKVKFKEGKQAYAIPFSEDQLIKS